MRENLRPIYFYLFRKGTDIEIVSMTDIEASKLYESRRWLDVGQKTKEDAEALRRKYLSDGSVESILPH